MVKIPDNIAESALARLFNDSRLEPEITWFSLPGGAILCEAGEPADQLFFVRAGRLAAFRQEEGHEPRFLGVIRPGEPAGEMAMIAGSQHSARVVALRDSEILAMPRAVFFAAAERDPVVMIELARLMIRRARQTAGRASTGDPSVFGFVGVDRMVKVRDLVEKLATAIEAFGYSVTTIGEEGQHAPTEWFSNVEGVHDFVLYSAEADQIAWKQIVGRQVDRLFRIARGDKPPPSTLDYFASPALEKQFLLDLILVQPRGVDRPVGSEAWMEAVRPARLFHIRSGSGADIDRIARLLAGRSVGLVLSGGGARAYAHVGAIRELRKVGCPIDFIGGSSMGAVVGAAVAMGWDDEEIDWRLRKAFVETNPLADIALPLIAMTLGEVVGARLKEHFGEQQISDLWLPFFCISSNLTSGSFQTHRRGLLREALRASIAIPGLLPPAVQDNNVLVDGAVMKNFPTDVMRGLHLGPVVGVDVTRGRNITADEVARPSSVWRWFLSGQWRKGPPIVSLLLRTATVSTGREIVASREATDLLVLPKMETVEIRDWEAYDEAAAAGEAAMQSALATLTRPVTELRRRASLEELAEAAVAM
ncbi:patatin-like phospholipase family protein [Phenylobacterium montanum]|uniref:Patatin-like phospholipase family protein n=1 Tax=Phenylobacterium montanum TaxID=2823693 RepID=A0A975G1V5_9CAUL|nr:patatin-like phospholipase family protein [Caulobacter sp. S6]QUD88451.1 patatin-like phospholipase family protein [Caulobacter sp. S6]